MSFPFSLSPDTLLSEVSSFSRTQTELDHDWHKIRLVISEMIHFIRQLEAYYRLEVIECLWKELNEFLKKKEGDLDALIEAHRSYLDNMVKKILLWNSKPGREVCNSLFNVLDCSIADWRRVKDVLLKQVLDLLNTALHFREVMVSF